MTQIKNQSDPGVDLVPVVPNDSADLPVPGRSIRCRPDGTAGSIRFEAINGQERTSSIAAGGTLMVGVRKVFATGTTATGLEVYV